MEPAAADVEDAAVDWPEEGPFVSVVVLAERSTGSTEVASMQPSLYLVAVGCCLSVEIDPYCWVVVVVVVERVVVERPIVINLRTVVVLVVVDYQLGIAETEHLGLRVVAAVGLVVVVVVAVAVEVRISVAAWPSCHRDWVAGTETVVVFVTLMACTVAVVVASFMSEAKRWLNQRQSERGRELQIEIIY